jgi:peptidoglycan/LPS O-acetylase OafA/YrhL
MKQETSVYLDLVRFLAALTVCIGHLSGARLTGGLLWQVAPFMSAAVAIFFVLSGFVIGHVTSQRERTARDYVLSRAARIYSVALPALVFTLALDSIGRFIRPDLYTQSWGYVADGRLWQFLSGALFLNQLWFLNVTQGSMLPYWSLSFEVWYYIIFGLALFAPPRWRVVAAVAALAVAGPRAAVMFPLWLLGAWCAHAVGRLPQRSAVGWPLFLGSIVLVAGYGFWARGHGRLLGFVPSVLNRAELLEDYGVAVLFAANLMGFVMVSQSFAAFARAIARPVRWLAGATFTLYLLHIPIAQFLTTIVPWPPSAAATRVVILGVTMLAVFAIAAVTERRKAEWRTALAALMPRPQAKLAPTYRS